MGGSELPCRGPEAPQRALPNAARILGKCQMRAALAASPGFNPARARARAGTKPGLTARADYPLTTRPDDTSAQCALSAATDRNRPLSDLRSRTVLPGR